MTICAVIVDDHRLFRNGLKALLETVDDIEVVGEAASGPEAIEVVRATEPGIVLMDLQMPGGHGLDAIRTLVATEPGIRILVLTMFEDDESVFSALRAGALGYVLKDADEDEIVRAVQTVAGGGATYSAGVAARMAAFFASLPVQAPATDAFTMLTTSERRVLEQMARGLNNDAIAAVLGYSQKTVRNYVSIIFAKLQVADRSAAIATARDHGIGGQEPQGQR